MFFRTVLIVLSAAAFSAAAQAAAPCTAHGKANCHKPAGGATAPAAQHALHEDARQTSQSKPSYAPAEALLARNLAERRSKLGEEHPYTLTTANSLATVYKAQGR